MSTTGTASVVLTPSYVRMSLDLLGRNYVHPLYDGNEVLLPRLVAGSWVQELLSGVLTENRIRSIKNIGLNASVGAVGYEHLACHMTGLTAEQWADAVQAIPYIGPLRDGERVYHVQDVTTDQVHHYLVVEDMTDQPMVQRLGKPTILRGDIALVLNTKVHENMPRTLPILAPANLPVGHKFFRSLSALTIGSRLEVARTVAAVAILLCLLGAGTAQAADTSPLQGVVDLLPIIGAIVTPVLGALAWAAARIRKMSRTVAALGRAIEHGDAHNQGVVLVVTFPACRKSAIPLLELNEWRICEYTILDGEGVLPQSARFAADLQTADVVVIQGADAAQVSQIARTRAFRDELRAGAGVVLYTPGPQVRYELGEWGDGDQGVTVPATVEAAVRATIARRRAIAARQGVRPGRLEEARTALGVK